MRRSRYKGVETTPKSGRGREIPLADSAIAALRAHRHLKGDYVFCNEDGAPLRHGQTNWPLYRAAKRAGLRACTRTCSGTHSRATLSCAV